MGVITMKMISNTSITSTMGVTLMSELTLAPSFLLLSDIICSPARSGPHRSHLRLIRPLGGQDSAPKRLSGASQQLTVENQPCSGLGPANSPLLEEVIDQFARGVIHLHVERFHAASQIVEHHDRRNRLEEADRGGYEGFGNTAGDSCQTGGLF